MFSVSSQFFLPSLTFFRLGLGLGLGVLSFFSVLPPVPNLLQGAPGAQGPRGAPGGPGGPGTNGRNGNNGAAGNDGDDGANGARGPAGQKVLQQILTEVFKYNWGSEY